MQHRQSVLSITGEGDQFNSHLANDSVCAIVRERARLRKKKKCGNYKGHISF